MASFFGCRVNERNEMATMQIEALTREALECLTGPRADIKHCEQKLIETAQWQNDLNGKNKIHVAGVLINKQLKKQLNKVDIMDPNIKEYLNKNFAITWYPNIKRLAIQIVSPPKPNNHTLESEKIMNDLNRAIIAEKDNDTPVSLHIWPV